MKVLLEVDSSQNNMPDILRKVFSKRANQIEIICDEQGVVVIDTKFNDEIFFEELVNLLIGIKFRRVLMLNPPIEDEEVGDEPGEDKPVDFPVKGDETGGSSGEDKPVGFPAKGDETGGNSGEDKPVGFPAKGGETGESLTDKKPKGRKKKEENASAENKKLSNLFEISEFPRVLTVDNIVRFFSAEKNREKEALSSVIALGLNKEIHCEFDWKDMVRAASEMKVHLTDYDRLLASKRIKETFEKYGYTLLMKGFLRLLRQHVTGKIKPDLKKSVSNEPQKLDKIDSLTDIEDFKWLNQIKFDKSHKEDIIVRILKSMNMEEKLSVEAQRVLYYMSVFAVSVKEFKPEGVDLLIKDMNRQDVIRTPEIDKELQEFVKNFFVQRNATAGYYSFFKLLNGYFNGLFTEHDSDFVERIKPYESFFVFEEEHVEPQEEPTKDGKFSCMPYCEELEEFFEELWNEGLSCDELLISLFEKMSGEKLLSNESTYLEICANSIAFDSLDSMYIDLGVSQIEARRIQCSLSDKLGKFTDEHQLPEVRLFDFINDVRTIFENEA